MSALQSLPIDAISDHELVERLFQLATAGESENGELIQLDNAVYGRLVQAYGETNSCMNVATAPMVNPAIRPQLVAI